MSKHQKKSGPPRYVMLFHWMLKSDAWRDLDAVARAIYLELERRYNGSNNGMIHYSVREAARDVKVSKGTAARGFENLQRHGFIAIHSKGRFSCKVRHATEWRLTIYDSNIEGLSAQEKLNTKDFMRWPEIQNPVPVVRLTGRVVRPYGTRSETVTPKTRSDGIARGTVKAGYGG